MTNDALDPGPGGTFPFWPRKADGSPDPARMPTGLVRHRKKDGEVVLVDQTPRDKAGRPIVPPTLPPGGPRV